MCTVYVHMSQYCLRNHAFVLKDVLTCSSFEQQEHQQTAGIIENQKFETWTIWKFQSAYNRNPIFKIAMKHGQFEQVFSVQKSGFPPFLPSSQFFGPDVAVVPGAGRASKRQQWTRPNWENSDFLFQKLTAKTPGKRPAHKKKRESFRSEFVSCFSLVLGPVHSTENDCQHWTSTNANAVKNCIST